MEFVDSIILFLDSLGTPKLLFLCVFLNLLSIPILSKIEKSPKKTILFLLFIPYFLFSVSLAVYVVYVGISYNS